MAAKYLARGRYRSSASRVLSGVTATLFLLSGLAAASPLFLRQNAEAATESKVVVRETDVTRQAENTPPTGDWVIYTRTATPGTATFRAGPANPPLGVGSLEFKTTGASDKVFAFNFDHAGKKLADIDTMSYNTYRTAGELQQVTALNMVVDENGPAEGGFTTLVFEPVYNTSQGPVASGEWQDWDAYNGTWWSTRAIPGQCAGATAECDRTWSEIVTSNPEATILAFGLNQGGGNPGLTTATDALSIGFNGATTTYNFEPPVPATPDQLGWKNPTVACGGSTTSTSITADWNDIDDADSYEYRVYTPQRTEEATAFVAPTTTSQFNGTFNEGTGTYKYQVRANVDGVWSEWSTTCSITYNVADTTAPVAPRLRSPDNNETVRQRTFDFRWRTVEDAITYNFQAATDRNFTSVISDRKGLTSTTLSSPNTPNGTYFWRVQAVDAAGNTSEWSNVRRVTVNVRALRAPELKSPERNATVRDDDFTFKWRSVDNPNWGTVRYQIQTSSSNAVKQDGSFATTLADRTQRDNRLESPNTPNGVYYWHVRAIDADGNPGPWSPVWKLTVRNR